MSKHFKLTEEEFSNFNPNVRLLSIIEQFRKDKNLRKKDMNILDWGCGRGLMVLWLREQGYNAFGVDIDIIPIQNGINLFQNKGYDASILKLLSAEETTEFPDNFFHFIFSLQVFEHIENIKSVACEMRRITKTEGRGFHKYPAHKYLVEGHLYMPFVHWLPKNILRKYLIAIYVLIGKEPKWVKLDNLSLRKKINIYYHYSIRKTYYRTYSYVKEIFISNGFYVKFVSIENPKLTNHKFLGKFLKFNLSRLLINYLLLNFHHVELLIENIRCKQEHEA